MSSILVSFFNLCFEINASMVSKKSFLLTIIIVFWKSSLAFKWFLHFLTAHLPFTLKKICNLMLLINAGHVTRRAEHSGGKFCCVCRGWFDSDSHRVGFIRAWGKAELGLKWLWTLQPWQYQAGLEDQNAAKYFYKNTSKILALAKVYKYWFSF